MWQNLLFELTWDKGSSDEIFFVVCCCCRRCKFSTFIFSTNFDQIWHETFLGEGLWIVLYYLLFFITFTNLSYIRHCWSISTHSSFIWQCNNSFGISTTFLTYDVHENIVIWWLIMLWKFFLYVKVRKNRTHWVK